MKEEPDRFLNRMRWVFLLFAILLVLWQFLPWIEHRIVALTTEPRAVTARGELAADERATIEFFYGLVHRWCLSALASGSLILGRETLPACRVATARA